MTASPPCGPAPFVKRSLLGGETKHHSQRLLASSFFTWLVEGLPAGPTDRVFALLELLMVALG